MDRVSDRDRSSRKSRDERDPDRVLDRDRDHKHRHRHDDEKRHESRDRHRHSKKNDEDEESRNEKRPDADRHRRSNDDKDRQRRSRADSPEEASPRRETSSDRFRGSVELPKDQKHPDGERRRRYRDDSPQDLEPRREPSSDRFRGSVERPKDEKLSDGERRRSRYRDDSPQDLAPRHKKSSDKHTKDEKHRDRERERSLDGVRDSVERGRVSREESVERHHHSSRKRKEHDVVEDDSDKRGKRVKGSDGSRDDREARRERRRFADRSADGEDNGDYRAERTREKISKDNMKGERLDVEEDRERKSRVEKEFDDEDERKSTRDKRKFNDGIDTKKRREEYGMDEDVKGDDLRTTGERKPSVFLGRNGDNSASAKSGSTKVSQEPLTSNVSMTSAAPSLPIPTKVSLITTTNENGVNITRSDEVHGKSSTDGTTTLVSGKSGTLDALAKAKKTLQLQKELNEKLKKISMLNKLGTTNAGMNSQAAGNKTGFKIPSSVITSTTSATISSVQATLGSATSESMSAAAGMGVIPGASTSTNFEAVKRAQELAAKMGFRQDPEFAPLINMFPGPATADATLPEKPAKAPVLRLDAQGREIDEHGHVINMPKLTNLSTLKVNINKQKKDAFQILRPELDADTRSNPHFDPSMGIDKMKLLRPKRMTFQFVDEGRWSKQAELIKFKNQFGEAQAKELKMKQSQLAKAKGEIDNPNLIEVPDRFDRAPKDKKKDDIPEIEWWDKPLLPSGSYIDIGTEAMCMDKITIYVEHPRPIEPPAEPAPPPPQPLKLTKKEQKKLRTQRRLAKEKDRQEMIRQGLIEPPKPKVKMSNLMKVLGSEATQDPTRLEMEIRSAAAEREQAHVDRNIARKLTPAERREKKERKLFEDPNTLETFVSVYKIKDLSHPKTRFKVDVNAQENRLSGVAVISDGVTVVVVEGGRKSINRYGKLMLNRIDWASAVGNGEEGAENSDIPVNSCGLVWQGTVARPSFHRFIIHQCRTDAAAKKVFADAGVPHYWDLAINFTDEVL